jgi:hypothetical protein
MRRSFWSNLGHHPQVDTFQNRVLALHTACCSDKRHAMRCFLDVASCGARMMVATVLLQASPNHQ